MAKNGYHDLERGQPLVSRGWRNAKIILRVFSLLLACGAIGLEVPTAISYQQESDRLSLEYSAGVSIALTVGPPIVMAIWDTIEFITLCARHGRGVHPGFHVAFELIFWICGMALTGLVTRIAWVATDNANYIKNLLDTGNNSDLISYSDLPIFQGFAIKTKIAAALFGLLTTTRFILFVRACIETHHRRNAKRWGGNPVIVTTHHGHDPAAVPLTAYQPQVQMPVGAPPPQYYDYAKQAVPQVHVSQHPAFQQPAFQQPRY